MDIKLKTQMKAVSRLSPSILENYVTKDSLSKTLGDYVTETALDEKNFVTEVENPTAGVIYGRVEENGVMTWTAAVVPEQILLYGFNKTESTVGLDGQAKAQFVSTLNAFSTNTVTYKALQLDNGYFWFLSVRPISQVAFVSGNQRYIETLTESAELSTTITTQTGDTTRTFHCYRTNKYVVNEGIEYNYEVTLAE